MNLTSYESMTGFVVVFAILDVVAAISNLAVMLLIVHKTSLRTVSNLLVCELAFSDFLMAILVVPFSILAYKQQSWPSTEGLCVFHGYFFNMLYIVSATLTSVISVDRYYSLANPMSHTANVSGFHLLWTTGFVLVHSVFWVTFPLYDIENLNYLYLPRQTRCGFDWRISGGLGSYLFFMVLVTFGIPVFATIIMYHKSVQAALESARKIRPGNVQFETFSDGNFTTVARAESVGSMKGIMTVSVIIGSFVISRAPMMVCNIGSWYNAVEFCSAKIELGFSWLQYLGALTNPYVYTFLNRRLRKECKNIIKLCSRVRTNNEEEEPKDMLEYIRNLTNESRPPSLPTYERSSAGTSHLSTEIETLQIKK